MLDVTRCGSVGNFILVRHIAILPSMYSSFHLKHADAPLLMVMSASDRVRLAYAVVSFVMVFGSRCLILSSVLVFC